MPKFVKKPVVIEAIQYTGTNLKEVLEFTGKHPSWHKWFDSFESYQKYVDGDNGNFHIVTPEGTMKASIGDWIIEGVSGEHYPCKPDIFKQTYQLVTE